VVVQEGIIPRFFDRLDGVEPGLPEDLLAADFEFEMVFPEQGAAPAERVSRTKQDFIDFMQALRARGPSPHATPGERRHHIRILETVDGIEFMLGTATGGRRQGTILAVAQTNGEGLMTRYVVVMSTVTFAG
jgi:hypothetical protein